MASPWRILAKWRRRANEGEYHAILCPSVGSHHHDVARSHAGKNWMGLKAPMGVEIVIENIFLKQS